MTLMISPRWFQWPSGSRANGLEFDRDGAAVAHGGSMSLVQESPKLLRVLVVAPDLGAVKLAREYARLLHLPWLSFTKRDSTARLSSRRPLWGPSRPPYRIEISAALEAGARNASGHPEE